MLKANARVTKNAYTKEQGEFKLNRFKELLKQFKESGEFEYFKTTSSYIEIPPRTASDDASTYIIRQYKGVQFITLGHVIYYVNTPELQNLLMTNPNWNTLGGTNKEIIRAEACFCYMNAHGKMFHRELIENWEELTKPFMIFRGY